VSAYRKKPVVIDAMQMTWETVRAGQMPREVRIVGFDHLNHMCGFHGEIDTLEGTMRADEGDWIIRGVKGEVYPCKPDIFAATYEPAAVASPPERAPGAAGGALDDEDEALLADLDAMAYATPLAGRKGTAIRRAADRLRALLAAQPAAPDARGDEAVLTVLRDRDLTHDTIRRLLWKQTAGADLDTGEGCTQAAEAVANWLQDLLINSPSYAEALLQSKSALRAASAPTGGEGDRDV
jgi:hypothetical protein